MVIKLTFRRILKRKQINSHINETNLYGLGKWKQIQVNPRALNIQVTVCSINQNPAWYHMTLPTEPIKSTLRILIWRRIRKFCYKKGPEMERGWLNHNWMLEFEERTQLIKDAVQNGLELAWKERKWKFTSRSF